MNELFSRNIEIYLSIIARVLETDKRRCLKKVVVSVMTRTLKLLFLELDFLFHGSLQCK